jgi:hypothetical protein
MPATVCQQSKTTPSINYFMALDCTTEHKLSYYKRVCIFRVAVLLLTVPNTLHLAIFLPCTLHLAPCIFFTLQIFTLHLAPCTLQFLTLRGQLTST